MMRRDETVQPFLKPAFRTAFPRSIHQGKPQASETLSRLYLSAAYEAMRKMTAEKVEAEVRRLMICLSFAQQG
jgi:hypothetical protein